MTSRLNWEKWASLDVDLSEKGIEEREEGLRHSDYFYTTQRSQAITKPCTPAHDHPYGQIVSTVSDIPMISQTVPTHSSGLSVGLTHSQ